MSLFDGITEPNCSCLSSFDGEGDGRCQVHRPSQGVGGEQTPKCTRCGRFTTNSGVFKPHPVPGMDVEYRLCDNCEAREEVGG